jgi:RNA polymerase-binding transcription factor DksA
MTHGRPGRHRYDRSVDESGSLGGSELGVLDRVEAELADVQSALDRLDDGSYGRCEQCGTEIDEEILESSPAARFCGNHLPFRQAP